MGEARVRWNDAKAGRARADECAVAVTRERVVVSFGVSQVPQAGQPDVIVEVAREVAMTPYVAKRLAVLLERVLREHRSRYGHIRGDAPPAGKKRDCRGTV
jgi:uncharacterized protein DUF3467